VQAPRSDVVVDSSSLQYEHVGRRICVSALVERAPKGPMFSMELVTVDVDRGVPRVEDRKRSAISVVVDVMGLPNSFPVPWYHKVLIVDEHTVAAKARDLLEDMDLAWCKRETSFTRGCPPEKIPPME